MIFPINNDDTSTSWRSHPSKSELCGQESQESDLRLYAQCVFSVCGPGVRVMLPGLTADQSVHCSSADQLGPGSVCWSRCLPPAPWRASAAARQTKTPKYTSMGRSFKNHSVHWSCPPNVIFKFLYDTWASPFNVHTDRSSVTSAVVNHNEGNDVAHLLTIFARTDFNGFFFCFFCF